MKQLLFITLIAAFTLLCNRGGNVAGTADDTNAGSLFGKLLTEDNEKSNDTVTVELYAWVDNAEELSKRSDKKNEPLKTLICTDGSYEFDSLSAGIYDIVVTREGVVIGGKDSLTLKMSEHREVDITIVIIIKQTFNITTVNNNQNITINNIHMDNGVIERLDSGYVMTTAENDTLYFTMDIIKDNDTSTVTARIIRNEDGSAEIEIIETENGDEEIEVVITPGTKPATGYLGEIVIDLKEPGTVKVDSEFDDSGKPEKSR